MFGVLRQKLATTYWLVVLCKMFHALSTGVYEIK